MSETRGHPDIIVLLGGRLTTVAADVASMGKSYHVTKPPDAQAVAPTERNEHGYLAVLDIAEPVRWTPVEYSRIHPRLERQPLATLLALAPPDQARACNDAFAEIIIADVERLLALTFHLLCRRVLLRNS